MQSKSLSLTVAEILKMDFFRSTLTEVDPSSFAGDILCTSGATQQVARIANILEASFKGKFNRPMLMSDLVAMTSDELIAASPIMRREGMKPNRELGAKRIRFLEAYLYVFGLKLKDSKSVFAANHFTHEAIEEAKLRAKESRKKLTDKKAVSGALLNAPIEVLELTRGIKKSLTESGINTVRDLASQSERELLLISNIGQRKLRDTREALAQVGLHLGSVAVQ